MQIALTLFPGVSSDECEAFTLAFAELARIRPGQVELIGVGARPGTVAGPGGSQRVEATFAEVRHPDVVLVPGGLGVGRTSHDTELLQWLRDVEPTCQWMAASSTGTVVVAAAGLLGDHEAATHWLAGPLLAEFGSVPSRQRIVEVGHILTCHGHISAMDVALLMILRLSSRSVVAEVRAGMELVGHNPVAPERTWRSRFAQRRSRHSGARASPRPRNEELEMADWAEFEMVEHDG